VVTVVTFHAPTRIWEVEAHPYGGIRLPHSDLLPIFLASIRRYAEEASVCLITTREVAVDNLEFDRVELADIDPARLMLDRLVQQRRILAKTHGPVAFLDTDVLVLRPLASIFTGDFDLAVTIRDKPQYEFERTMPYNNGVWFCHGSNREAELGYIDRLIAMNSAMPAVAHAWSGNQFAVRDLLGIRASGERFQLGALQVAVLPCSVYNYAPQEIGEDVGLRHILHFRGEAKHLMKSYASRFLDCSMS
jgi:hypothetical protein